MRLFVAVELDPEAKRVLERAVERLRRVASLPSGLRWLDPVGWHVTLQFLGDVQPGQVDALVEAVTEAASTQAPFDLTLGAPASLGAFPRSERARVLWAGVGPGAHRLEALARSVWQRTEPLGFPLDTRPFRPHITLARARRPVAAARLVEAFQLPPTASPVSGLTLFCSHLGVAGARYEALQHALLRS